MPDGLILTAASGRKNFSILIRDRDEIDLEGVSPMAEGELLAQILWNMLPWATVRATIGKLNEWENVEI